MLDLTWKAIENGPKSLKIMRYFIVTSSLVYVSTIFFNTGDLVANACSHVVTGPVLSVARISLVVAASLVTAGLAAMFAADAMNSVADRAYDRAPARCWLRLLAVTGRISNSMETLIEVAMHVVLSAISFFLVLGIDWLAQFCVLVPGKAMQAVIVLMNLFVLIFLLFAYAREKFVESDSAQPPLGA